MSFQPVTKFGSRIERGARKNHHGRKLVWFPVASHLHPYCGSAMSVSHQGWIKPYEFQSQLLRTGLCRSTGQLSLWVCLIRIRTSPKHGKGVLLVSYVCVCVCAWVYVFCMGFGPPPPPKKQRKMKKENNGSLYGIRPPPPPPPPPPKKKKKKKHRPIIPMGACF